jgi:predicted nucleic acid-binding protein
LELLLNTPRARAVAERVLDPAENVAAPHLLDVEVLQGLRRYARQRILDADRGRQAIEDLGALPLTRYPHGALADRVWELRDNLTAYDATYVALAEALDAVLLTGDGKLAGAPGHRVRIEVV